MYVYIHKQQESLVARAIIPSGRQYMYIYVYIHMQQASLVARAIIPSGK